MPEVGVVPGGFGEGAGRRVERQDVVAAAREPAREHPDGATDFERPAVARTRQDAERRLVLAALVGAGAEAPGIGRPGVDRLEIAAVERGAALRHGVTAMKVSVSPRKGRSCSSVKQKAEGSSSISRVICDA